MTKQFGQTASDAREARAARDGEIWIRYFKNPSTRIRIIPMVGLNKRGKEVVGTDCWPTELEHYDEVAGGSFPCDESSSCPACRDSNPRVSRRTKKYYFHALDEGGNVRIYKIGYKLYTVLQTREQRLGTLSDRDYIINKMGTGLDTTYDPEPGEKYEVDFEGLELPNIAEVLTQRYTSAMEKYAEAGALYDDGQDPTPKEEREPATVSTGRIQPKAPQAAPAQEPTSTISGSWSETGSQASQGQDTPPAEVPDWGTNPSAETIEDAETGVIKKWLESREIEFPSRAPRARIVQIAQEAAAKPPY